MGLKKDVTNLDVRMWNGFIGLRTGTRGGLLNTKMNLQIQ
jgi:hypothetical protein